MQLETLVERRPILSLTLLFAGWKLLILTIVLLSPGIGYDTSTSILLQDDGHALGFNQTPDRMEIRLFNLVRWDAIYYSQMAQRGHVFEQEWAFGVGLSTTTSYLTRFTLGGHELRDFVLVGVVLSHVSHWLSAVLLWSVAYKCNDSTNSRKASVAFVAAALHILSPGGVFLSAPYAESLFSFLSMLGYYLYISSKDQHARSKIGLSLKILLSGMVFGCATTIRSNGVLNGLPFLVDAVNHAWNISNPRTADGIRSALFLNLVFTILGGSCIAIGMIIPQFIAYQDYCMGSENLRPWCSSMPPSIFTWVQSHYWNVGFLRYWTLSNVPLFLLATPVLLVLILSGGDGCMLLWTLPSSSTFNPSVAGRLALPQLVLAILALTSYHVQIITRLSSGSPFWYIWLATKLDDWKYSTVFVRIMVMYGLIQAVLYASFLPPA